MEKLVRLAIDTYKGVPSAFSEGNPTEVIRNALIEANGGATKITMKQMRDGGCKKLFALVEELIIATVLEGLPESNPIFQWAETKNGKLGDKPEFVIEPDSILTVSTVAAGTQGIRRQRMFGQTRKTLTPMLHAIKIYEELDLILSGRIDWVKFVDQVSRAFIVETNTEIANAFVSLFNNADVEKRSGSYSEATLLELIEKVEMLNPGKTARIYGTKTALRKINMAVSGDEIKSDYYNMGFAGKFNGTECFELKNALKNDRTTKVLNDTDIYVVASDDKFIKYYNEGDATIIEGNPLDNADLTQEYLVANKWAVAVVFSDKMGVYRI